MTHRITRLRLTQLASQLSGHACTIIRVRPDQRFATTHQLAHFLMSAFRATPRHYTKPII